MIVGYRNKETAAIAAGRLPKRFPADLRRRTIAKLRFLDAAKVLDDLRSPPGNHLEALSGDRRGQHSIRVNRQFRICFVWTDAGPDEVEFVDYHKG